MLPRLRTNLDFFPSPVQDKPGLVIRDPFHYSDATLIIPPALVAALEFFDGEHSELDLRHFLVQVTGDLQIGELQQHLIDTLSKAGFLEDDNFAQQKIHVERNFAEGLVRQPAHAGSGYPESASHLTETLRTYMNGAPPPAPAKVLGIAAPHVSPFGGIEAYRAAYSALSPEDADRTFIILGTSHYGEPDRIGLTRKPFRTPFGDTRTDLDVVNRIATEAGDAAKMEDYCQAIEHSIEFQVVFLQHLFGPAIRVVPILCGSYARSIYQGGLPEQSDGVNRIFGALGDLAAREGSKLCWILGVDMAHMGRRYGDSIDARADEGEMDAVARRDRSRIDSIEAGDAQAFWSQVQENQDDLKWCGSAPIYTFLRSVPSARGRLLRYQQWNIDEQSVVSFAGISFHAG